MRDKSALLTIKLKINYADGDHLRSGFPLDVDPEEVAEDLIDYRYGGNRWSIDITLLAAEWNEQDNSAKERIS